MHLIQCYDAPSLAAIYLLFSYTRWCYGSKWFGTGPAVGFGSGWVVLGSGGLLSTFTQFGLRGILLERLFSRVLRFDLTWLYMLRYIFAR